MSKSASDLKNIKLLENRLDNITLTWAKIVAGICLFLLFAITLAYLGLFNIFFLSLGFLLLIFFMKVHSGLNFLLKEFFLREFDFLKLLVVFGWLLWFLLLLGFFSFPAFSGRDEGSYANAAIYLAKFKDITFHLPLLDYLNAEGPAHQSLNFPGFVIKDGNLTSQFSPAYTVWLGVFFLVFQTVFGFAIANGILILGGGISFYILLRFFASRWLSSVGLMIVLFNFLFLWFPRFTLSENLAFFLFFNLLLFLFLFRKSLNNSLLLPISALIILFPLVRPEGWWVLIITLILLFFWYRKGLIKIPARYFAKLTPIFFGGIIFAGIAFYFQFSVYRRLVRDWLEWSNTSSSYANILAGNFAMRDLGKIILAPLPSWQRFFYFIKVEWNYGVLIFGLIALVVMAIFILDRQKKFFSRDKRILLVIAAILSFPFFTAFISPQISSDHPWMLRRFFFVVLPCGILASFVLLVEVARRVSKESAILLISLSPAILLLPSMSAGAYFLTVKLDVGREKAFEELSRGFQSEDFVFLSRESSGDGWRMWADSLSSLYDINAAYVYSPENITDFRQVLYDRFSEGSKTYVVLPENAFDFEHGLKKYFNLILDREIFFTNNDLVVQNGLGNTDFPVMERRAYSVRVYLLTPK